MPDYNQLEPAAKVLAATGVADTINFCMQRNYLQRIDTGEYGFLLQLQMTSTAMQPVWIKICQVGRPVQNAAETLFTAIQKILFAAHMPRQTQLLFLVKGDGGRFSMYLGIRSFETGAAAKNFVKNWNEFAKGVWPGLQTEVVRSDDPEIADFSTQVREDGYEYISALTGVPSMETQYKTLYPATIDNLMAGMTHAPRFAYLVVADPVPVAETESMLYQCREMGGQAESLKSINVTESLQQNEAFTQSDSHGTSQSIAESVSENLTRRDFSRLGNLALKATGLGLAASVMPAAGAVFSSVAEGTGTLISAAAGFFGGTMVGGMVRGLGQTKTTGKSRSETSGSSDTHTEGHTRSEGRSQSVSRNLVNKHIEAVAEHLFYHSRRFETGKATGMWRVGTYLLTDRRSDMTGAALQLRSILSGQESIYEPIRSHDISAILESTPPREKSSLKSLTLAELKAPGITICDRHGSPFRHPLGQSYQELRTVLTTKELSYLVNFPLRGVPGISVVPSSPAFSLSAQKESEQSMPLGKILYGGSPTTLEYSIPRRSLSRHTLVCGINGSGKTNTVQALLRGIGDMPFLIIEPAKTEYVDWALQYNKEHPDRPIDIYIPGCNSYRGGFQPKELRINPFDIVWLNPEREPNVLSHIDRLKSTMAAAFPMYDILPVLMEDLIYTVYQNPSTDWLTKAPEWGKTIPPTLRSMSVNVDKVLSSRGYEQRVEQNMKACLNTRIDALKRGWKGKMLNTVHSTPWKELYERPVLVNLSYVDDDVDKGFIMSLLLQFLYEYCQAKAENGEIDFNSGECRHLTVVEEAHRVMSRCDNMELPQYKSAMV